MDRPNSIVGNATNGSPSTFFALTFLLSVPFYILNALAYLKVVGQPEMGALYIALFTLTPLAAASILTVRRRGGRGLRQLLGRIFDFKSIAGPRWYVPILLLPPLILLISLGGLVLSGVQALPPLAPLVALPAVFPFFFLLAASEEVGWMGFAFEPLQTRLGALHAALVLGTVWAIWHIPFFVFMMSGPAVLCAQLLTLVGTRVLIAWIFNNTGKSIFAASLFHCVDNTALVTLPDIKGVTPWGAVVPCVLIMLVAVFVVVLWGPRTLARYRLGNGASRAPSLDDCGGQTGESGSDADTSEES